MFLNSHITERSFLFFIISFIILKNIIMSCKKLCTFWDRINFDSRFTRSLSHRYCMLSHFNNRVKTKGSNNVLICVVYRFIIITSTMVIVCNIINYLLVVTTITIIVATIIITTTASIIIAITVATLVVINLTFWNRRTQLFPLRIL